MIQCTEKEPLVFVKVKGWLIIIKQKSFWHLLKDTAVPIWVKSDMGENGYANLFTLTWHLNHFKNYLLSHKKKPKKKKRKQKRKQNKTKNI